MPFEGTAAETVPCAVDLHMGARLAGRRAMLGLRSENVARRIGCDLADYLAYEAGTLRIPAARLFALHVTLGVPVRFFFDLYRGYEDAAEVWARRSWLPRQ